MQKKGKTSKEINENVIQKLSGDSLSYATVNKWAAEFKRGSVSKDDLRSGRPKSSIT